MAKVQKKKCDYGNPYMTKDMSHIVLKLILLRRIQKSPVYTYALLKEINGNAHISRFIKWHGGSVKNDLYNTVKVLEKSGYITTKGKIEDGRFKKYYTITESGEGALKESKRVFLNGVRELAGIIK